MIRLSIHLLGSFGVTLDAEVLTALELDTVPARQSCLAVESDRPHCREKLAGLFWPDRPEWPLREGVGAAKEWSWRARSVQRAKEGRG